ncbi:MAG: hypothetical protein AB1Z98_21655 [Nannocystaceae bacterium]
MATGSEAPAAPADGSWGMDEAASQDPESESDGSGRSLDELEASLLGYEDDLLAAGVPLPELVRQTRSDLGVPAAAPATADGALAAPDRCERICELTTNICGLSDRICAMADDRPDQTRYTKACERSTQDCDQAQRACEDCSE